MSAPHEYAPSPSGSVWSSCVKCPYPRNHAIHGEATQEEGGISADSVENQTPDAMTTVGAADGESGERTVWIASVDLRSERGKSAGTSTSIMFTRDTLKELANQLPEGPYRTAVEHAVSLLRVVTPRDVLGFDPDVEDH